MATMMSNEDKTKTALMSALGENFGKTVTPTLYGLWLELLRDTPVDVFRAATMHVIKNYEFKTMPPFAVIEKAIKEIGGNSEADISARAEHEWEALLEAVSNYNGYKMPQLESTTAKALRIMGGVDTACNWTTDKYEFLRREFLSIYKSQYGKVERDEERAALDFDPRSNKKLSGLISSTVKHVS